jgi:hypothetical protein
MVCPILSVHFAHTVRRVVGICCCPFNSHHITIWHYSEYHHMIQYQLSYKIDGHYSNCRIYIKLLSNKGTRKFTTSNNIILNHFHPPLILSTSLPNILNIILQSPYLPFREPIERGFFSNFMCISCLSILTSCATYRCYLDAGRAVLAIPADLYEHEVAHM